MFRLVKILCKIPLTKLKFGDLQRSFIKKAFVTKFNLPNNNPVNFQLPSSKWKNYLHSPQISHLPFALSILTWLGFTKDDEEKESELIMTLKRAVLCTQREEFDKAEQMLHLALRLAQQQQNRQGILYCYDLMANLAFNTYNLEKAEKLFVSVLQMLLGDGVAQDDLKVIHISLKLARICQLQANIERADLGYNWCLEQIGHHSKDSEEARLLYGVINDWYAQYLLDVNNLPKALIHLNEAYKVCAEIEGENNEKSMLLLNDLGITSFRAEDYDNAEKYLKEAISVGENLEDKSHLGVVHANLGLILLQKGVIKEAERFCVEGRKLGQFLGLYSNQSKGKVIFLGKTYENNESVEQSNYCLDQIKLNLAG